MEAENGPNNLRFIHNQREHPERDEPSAPRRYR
jgi:hypothetical protein